MAGRRFLTYVYDPRKLASSSPDALARVPPRRITTDYFDPATSESYDPNATPLNEAEPEGNPWSEMTTRDLKAAIEAGDSVKEIAMFLQYSEATVRAKMRELSLKARKPATRRAAKK
jgi:DNA-binding NarL/FixJ family response regulator